MSAQMTTGGCCPFIVISINISTESYSRLSRESTVEYSTSSLFDSRLLLFFAFFRTTAVRTVRTLKGSASKCCRCGSACLQRKSSAVAFVVDWPYRVVLLFHYEGPNFSFNFPTFLDIQYTSTAKKWSTLIQHAPAIHLVDGISCYFILNPSTSCSLF